MSQIRDLTGQTFGRLKVLAFDGLGAWHARWRCKCRCGRIVVVRGDKLLGGRIVSCGCQRRDRKVRRAAAQKWVRARRAEGRKGGKKGARSYTDETDETEQGRDNA